MFQDFFKEKVKFPVGGARIPCPTDTQHIVNISGYSWITSKIKESKEISPKTSNVLDIGCGAGYGVDAFNKEFAFVSGIDMDREAVMYARTNYLASSFLIMDATRLGFDKESFDIITALDVLEHVRDAKLFLHEMYRVLRPGGVCFIFTPQAQNGFMPLTNPHHVHEFTLPELTEMLEKQFYRVSFWGRKLSAALTSVEKGLDRVRQKDRYQLRRIIPRVFRHRLADWILKKEGVKLLKEVTVDDIIYQDTVTQDTNIIAICYKK